MPQNTPMKRQFTTIDGRTVMSNLPQHWGGNDWAITGVDNPLPVGNYVQTEAGVWIPQKGSDDGAADVRLTGSNAEKEVIFERKIRTTSRAARLITAPDGATGLLLVSHVHGITGNLAADEGVRVELDNFYGAAIFNISSERRDRASVQIIDVSRYGTNLEDATIKYSTTSYKKSVYPVFGGLMFRVLLEINGEYGSNEGVDSEVYINWIKR